MNRVPAKTSGGLLFQKKSRALQSTKSNESADPSIGIDKQEPFLTVPSEKNRCTLSTDV